MGAQQGDGVEHRVCGRVQPAHGPRQRRGQGQALRAHLALREQRPHPLERHAAHIRVARVVDREVVPEHRTAGLEPAPHRFGQRLLNGFNEDGREHGGLQHQVLTLRGQWVLRGVAQMQLKACGQQGLRGGVTLGQQLDAGQVLRRETDAQHLQQIAACTAAHLSQPPISRVAWAPGKQTQQGALALVQHLPDLRAQKAVTTRCRAAGIARGNRVQLLITLAHRIASMNRAASTG